MERLELPESLPLPLDVPLPCVELPSVGPDSSFDDDCSPPPSRFPSFSAPLRPRVCACGWEPSPMMSRHSRCTWCCSLRGADMPEMLTPPPLLPRLLHSLLQLPPPPRRADCPTLSQWKALPPLLWLDMLGLYFPE